MNRFYKHPLLWGIGGTLFALSANAQVKVGDNPTALAPNTVFHVEKGGNNLVINNSGAVGIGTTTPAPGIRLNVIGGNVAVGNDNSFCGYYAVSNNNNAAMHPFMTMLRSRGTLANPQYPQSGDVLGSLVTMDGVDPNSSGGTRVQSYASENFSQTGKGARLEFLTTPNGTTALQTKMTIADNGYIGIGTTAPQAILDIAVDTPDGMFSDDIHIRGYSNGPNAAGPGLLMYSHRGQIGAPASLTLNERMGSVFMQGYNGAGYAQVGINGYYRGGTTGRMEFFTSGGTMTFTESGDLFLNQGNAIKPGGGAWAATSDRRTKRDIRTYGDGLALVKQIRPVIFKYNGKGHTQNDGQDYYGVIAQEVQAVAPYMVKEVADKELGHKLTYDGTALTYALVNAVKELSAEVEQLKAEKVALKAQADKVTTLEAEVASIKALLQAGSATPPALTTGQGK